MDALYFGVSSERQTTENQFNDLLQVAEKDGSSRSWGHILQALSGCVYEEQLATSSGGHRLIYRVRPKVTDELAADCVYVEQGEHGFKRSTFRTIGAPISLSSCQRQCKNSHSTG